MLYLSKKNYNRKEAQKIMLIIQHKCIVCDSIISHNLSDKRNKSARIICYECQRIINKQKRGQNLMLYERLLL